MSAVFFQRTTPKARKIYSCSACEHLSNAWNRADLNLMTFAEKRAYIMAKRNGFKIQIGEQYIKQPQIYDGQFAVFRGIPAISGICSKYELYPED